MRPALNYLGQLRVYSLIDLIIFAFALTSEVKAILGIGLLWVSFLFYLEAQHQDELRLHVPRYAWAAIGTGTLFLLPVWLPPAFAVLSFMYTKKKRNKFFACTSPIWRGMQNAAIAYAFAPQFALLVFATTAIRNLVGDFRDIGDDHRNQTWTLPVAMGFRVNHHWAFYGHLICVMITTLLWSRHAEVGWGIVMLCWIAQIITYPMTPRSSNPSYLNFYQDEIILVDEQDQLRGQAKKLEAHRRGLLHRAFSIFVFDGEGRLLLQRRATGKYHSGGLWSNTCCGHPRPRETTTYAAHRRLQEEVGFDADLVETGFFRYAADLDNDLRENEIDHVWVGRYDGPIKLNPTEVSECKWVSLDVLTKDIEINPDRYTVWLKIIICQHRNLLNHSSLS